MKHLWRSLWLVLPSLGLLAAPLAAATPLSLLGDRFQVTAEWRTSDGQTGTGTPVVLTSETGYFWFFSPTNLEVIVKVLDACANPSHHFWVFAGGLTDVEVTLTVIDQANGESKVYRNPRGTPFAPIQDTSAFATCGVPHCGGGNPADLAASPRADPDLEALALAMSGTVVAPQVVYDRVAADMAAIRTQDPNLAIPFLFRLQPRLLVVSFDQETVPQVVGGTYQGWDCLNRRFEIEAITLLDEGKTAVLRFENVLDANQLAGYYRVLPGVVEATPDFALPPPESPAVPASSCGRREGDLHKYYFRLPDGALYFYSSQPGASPVFVDSTLGEPLPWIEDARACFQEHVVR